MLFTAHQPNQGPRVASLAAVTVIHLAVAAGLMAIPAVRERIRTPAPMFVEFREAPARERTPQPKPLPRPTLHDPQNVSVALPPIALAPEVAINPPREREPTISAPVFASAAPAASASLEPPRFDLAYLRNPPPAYPAPSRRLKEQGRVVLRVLVNASGEPQDVEVRSSSGFARLDRAAIDAVRHWRFAPARRGSESISAWALVPVLFKLET